MGDDREGGDALWNLIRRIIEHPDAQIRVIGGFIWHRLQGTGERRVQLTYGEIGEACGLTDHPVRSRLDRMEEENLIHRDRSRGGLKRGGRLRDRRGDYYALGSVSPIVPPPSPNPPARAGPTEERLEGVTSSPEPQDGLCSPDKEHEPDNTGHT